MTAVVQNPDCSTPQQALGDDFDIRDARNSGTAYWFIACRRCRLSWYLPKNPHKQTKHALAILRAHAEGHGP
jgi:hypothetical protein